MTVLLALGGLLAVLVVACWWESRSGRPAWGAHLDHRGAPTTTHASSRAGERSIGAILTTGAFLGMDGGGDGG